jgi:hypothetical protein
MRAVGGRRRARGHAGEKSMLSRRDELIRLLRNYHYARRRDAVIRIRRNRDRSLGPPLFDALKRECAAQRNWENLYHMIMALNEIEYKPAYDFLKELAGEEHEATILYTALGEALIRLGTRFEGDPAPLVEVLEGDNFILLDGAFRAVVRFHLCFDDTVVRKIIEFASRLQEPGSEVQERYAAGGTDPAWRSPNLVKFLKRCMDDPCRETSDAARRVLMSKYLV